MFEGARFGYYHVPFTDVTVSGATLIRCLVSVAVILGLLAWSSAPGLLLLWRLGVRIALRHVMTGTLVVLGVLAFTGVMVRFFGWAFLAGGVALLLFPVGNAAYRRISGKQTTRPSVSPTVASSQDLPERVFAMVGVGIRGAAILLLAAFVAGRHAALHQENYLILHGANTTLIVLADQVDKFLCVDSPGSPKAQFTFVSKAGLEAQGFTLERVGPIVLPFGIWDTPRGRHAWSWARQELQQE